MVTKDMEREIWERLAENPFIREMLDSYAGPARLTYKDGTPVQFNLKDRYNLYRYFTDSKGIKYCWTPHKDTRGWYWSFLYRPKGRVFKIVKAVKFRRRKAAKRRTLDRFNKANG